MAVCDFDMIFRFVVVGWEGTTHDSRVLTKTICNPQHNFQIPPSGKYFIFILFNIIVFIHYNNQLNPFFFRKILFSRCSIHTHSRFMAPYRNVRYWLSDFCSGGKTVGK